MPARSRDQLPNDTAIDISEAEIAAGMPEGELFVIEAQELQNRGVQIVDMHFVLDRGESEFIRRAVDVTAATPPPASHMLKP